MAHTLTIDNQPYEVYIVKQHYLRVIDGQPRYVLYGKSFLDGDDSHTLKTFPMDSKIQVMTPIELIRVEKAVDDVRVGHIVFFPSTPDFVDYIF